MLIAIRQGYFSREVLRGLLAHRFDDSGTKDWELWVAPPMDDRKQLEACLASQNVVGVISRGLSRDLVQFLEKRDIPVVSIRGPEEVAVIGVDNDGLLCESSSPSLSSVDLHAAEIGRAAAGHLTQLLKGELSDPLPHIAPAVMVVRESSHEVDRYLLVYQSAMNYIANHALRGPHVADVANACGVSKRGLERAFAKHAGGSPAEIIREQRTAGILRLLKNQSLGLANIAQQSGFSDASGLSNFIKHVTGKPPGAWRN